MHPFTVIRSLIWLAALSTGMNCHAREFACRAFQGSDTYQATQDLNQSMPGEMVYGTSRSERSFRRTADDEKNTWSLSALAVDSPRPDFAFRFGRADRSVVQIPELPSAAATPFLCAQLQI